MNFWIGCEGNFIEFEHYLINTRNPYLTECHRGLVDFSTRMMLQNKKPTDPGTLCLLGSVTRWATLYYIYGQIILKNLTIQLTPLLR